MNKHFKKNKVLITGGTGYIGTHLTKKLLDDNWEVLLIVRNIDNVNPEYKQELLTIYKIKENESFEEIISKYEPNIVIHLASKITGYDTNKGLEDLINSNIVFGTKIIEAMLKTNVKHFINTGTYWEHYDNSLYSPVDLYAASKHAFQVILQKYVESNNIKALTLKLHDTYGPADGRKKIITEFVKAAMTGKELFLSPGYQKLNLVHIDDVVQGYMHAVESIMDKKYKGHNEYFLKVNENYNLREIASIIEDILGKEINIQWGSIDYKERVIMEPPDVIPILPGWQPKVQLIEGIQSVIDDLTRA
tara:strand:- start:831 stop:1745 length:915 start_codon:yes stop_codon:yes gene_type:complete